MMVFVEGGGGGKYYVCRRVLMFDVASGTDQQQYMPVSWLAQSRLGVRKIADAAQIGVRGGGGGRGVAPAETIVVIVDTMPTVVSRDCRAFSEPLGGVTGHCEKTV